MERVGVRLHRPANPKQRSFYLFPRMRPALETVFAPLQLLSLREIMKKNE